MKHIYQNDTGVRKGFCAECLKPRWSGQPGPLLTWSFNPWAREWLTPRGSRDTRERCSHFTALAACMKDMVERLRGFIMSGNWPLTHRDSKHVLKGFQQQFRFWMTRHLLSGEGTSKEIGKGVDTISSNTLLKWGVESPSFL